MVFGGLFGKKKEERMPEREVMRPKAAFVPNAPAAPEPAAGATTVEREAGRRSEPLPDLDFSHSRAPAGTGAAPEKRDAAAEMSEFEKEFTESSVMAIDVGHGADSIQADIEQVAVLYANGQDAVVRPLIESLLPAYPGTEGIRLWNMLFDFLQLTNDRAAFDQLATDFVQACETSPPAWRGPLTTKPAAAGASVPACALQGVLTSDDLSVLAPILDALKAKRALRVDCGGVLGIDDEVSGRLADALAAARRQGVAIVLDHADALINRLRGRLTVGEAQSARSWVLLLELLQRHGTQEDFETSAVDFAVTFERSPPSWEEKPAPTLPPVDPAQPKRDEAFYLDGDIRNSHFDELAGVLATGEHVILDFSAVRRLDFFSAGQLVNRLVALKGSGREVMIRSPNHLVAELMGVVGLNKMARILVPKS
ncbi:MAG: STAS domain-containing protein [Betaproteobacteria bacterium]|nr:STAS domain-containing protein [Betaproteobacteria bacterium]